MSGQQKIPTSDLKTERKLIINVTYKCNNHCIFCSIADRDMQHGDFETQKKHIDEAIQNGVDLLDIDGGEPTLYPHLLDLIDYAHKAGMKRITITSNGRMFSDINFVKKLSKYPLSILVSLHSADQAMQDKLTTQVGSFKQCVRGIMNAKKYFPNLGLNTTVTSHNLDGLLAVGKLASKLHIKIWNIQYYTPFGDVDPSLAPDPYEAGLVISEAIEVFKKLMTINVINLPFCFLPGYEKWAIKDIGKSVRHMLFVSGEKVNLADFLAEKRFKNGRCVDCEYDKVCHGFWDFGLSEKDNKPYLIRMLDVIPGYKCSAECKFCAVEESLKNDSLSTNQIKREIKKSMAYDPQIIRFGGGEPTERKDLAELIAYAKKLQIKTISVQSNGFLLAKKSYLNSLINAGANKFNISIRGHLKADHEYLTGVKGSFEKMISAIKHIALDDSLILELDSILTKQTIKTLSEQVEFYHDLKVKKFNFWFVQAEGRASGNWQDLIPNIEDAAKAVIKAKQKARKLGIKHLRCYYIPYCFFKGQEELVWHPLEENATVIAPGGSFTLDQGKLDLGVKIKICESCKAKNKCFGVPESYLKLFENIKLEPYKKLPDVF